MQYSATLGEIKIRGEAIGLTVAALARRAGLAASTPHRWQHGTNEPLRSKERLLIEALERAEDDALLHLLQKVFPAPAGLATELIEARRSQSDEREPRNRNLSTAAQPEPAT